MFNSLKTLGVLTTLGIALTAGVGASAATFNEQNYKHDSVYDTNTADDVAWNAVDKDNNGYIDEDEIPFSPYRKYYCGFEGKGFDMNENERFIFYVPSTYFARSYIKEEYKNLESKSYYADVVATRELVANIKEQLKNKKYEKEYDTVSVALNNTIYYAFDANGNGVLDLYSEDTGYVANEFYDNLYYYNAQGTATRIYQFLERKGPSANAKQHDADFGDYWFIDYFNGEKFVNTSTMPRKYVITEDTVNKYRTLAWGRFVDWYMSSSKESQDIMQEAEANRNEQSQIIESILESTGQMGQNFENSSQSEIIQNFYQTEMANYSHQYDIDETCYLAVRNNGGSGADAIKSCGTYNATKAAQATLDVMENNKSWYEERVTTFGDASFQESLESMFSNFIEWATALVGEAF